jgi:cellulose synthase/poly-beta-1,6-N-acetylglucosamine synthase-like glycosyltransferase
VVAPISEDGHTTWQLYRAGARLTYTPAAVAYTMEPESWGEWYRQQLRWASGFFQIQRAYWREFRRPSTLLVIGGMMADLILAPLTYGATAWAVATDRLSPVPLAAWLVVFNVTTLVLASTVIGPRRAVANFLPHKVVAVATTSMYVMCGVREWVLGKHLGSWTGRHGLATEITPMSRRRKAVLTLGVGLLFGRPQRGRHRGTRVPILGSA